VHRNVKPCAALDLRNLSCLVDVKGQVEGEGEGEGELTTSLVFNRLYTITSNAAEVRV